MTSSPKNNQPSPDNQPLTVRGMFRQHLAVTNRKQRTIELYVSALEQFYNFIQKSPLRCTANDIRAFLFHLLHERGHASRTFNQILYGLKAFYEAFMPDVPIMETFTRHKVRDGNVITVTRHEFERMLKHTDNIKHRAVMVLLYSGGLRASEAATIDVADFDKEQMLIKVVGKGDVLRYTIFSQRCREILREYLLKEQRLEGYLFPGRNKPHLSKEMVGYIVREAARRCNLPKNVSPHTLRHSFATHFLETDGRLPVLQAMLGHKNPKTTFRYCHVDTSLIRSAKSPLDVDISFFGPLPRPERKAK
jgi:integrase/recombinase XerD